jgi:hypothetical protein
LERGCGERGSYNRSKKALSSILHVMIHDEGLSHLQIQNYRTGYGTDYVLRTVYRK